MIPFETVKQTLFLPDVANFYGVALNRQKNALCPFHNDHHPSMLVADDHYHCFACGAHGDVIDFTARLFGISMGDAARKLASDFGLSPETVTKVTPKYNIPLSEQRIRETLRDYVKKLEMWKAEYAPRTSEELLDVRFLEACKNLDRAKNFLDILEEGTPMEQQEVLKQLRKEAA